MRLRFELSALVKVAEWDMCSLARYCRQRPLRIVRSIVSLLRQWKLDRQMLAFSSNTFLFSERSAICGGAERRAREGEHRELGTKRRNACYYYYDDYYYYDYAYVTVRPLGLRQHDGSVFNDRARDCECTNQNMQGFPKRVFE